MNSARFILCFILISFLFACGQTGKLYLPKETGNTEMTPDSDVENDG